MGCTNSKQQLPALRRIPESANVETKSPEKDAFGSFSKVTKDNSKKVIQDLQKVLQSRSKTAPVLERSKMKSAMTDPEPTSCSSIARAHKPAPHPISNKDPAVDKSIQTASEHRATQHPQPSVGTNAATSGRDPTATNTSSKSVSLDIPHIRGLSLDVKVNVSHEDSHSTTSRNSPYVISTPGTILTPTGFPQVGVSTRYPDLPPCFQEEVDLDSQVMNLNIVSNINIYEGGLHRDQVDNPLYNSSISTTPDLQESVLDLINGNVYRSAEGLALMNCFLQSIQVYRVSSSMRTQTLSQIGNFSNGKQQEFSLEYRNLQSVSEHSCERLSDAYSTFQDTELTCVGEFIRQNCSVSKLTIHKAELSPRALEYFGQNLRYNNRLKVLDLSGNALRTAGIEALFQGLKQADNQVTELNLSNNEITDPGIIAICRYLLADQVRLEVLDVSRNCFSISGLDCLIRCLPAFCNLKQLLLIQSINGLSESFYSRLNKVNRIQLTTKTRLRFLDDLLADSMASTDAFVAALRQVRSENYVKGFRTWFSNKKLAIKEDGKMGLSFFTQCSTALNRSQPLKENSSVMDGSPRRRSSLLKTMKRLSKTARSKSDRSNVKRDKSKEEPIQAPHSIRQMRAMKLIKDAFRVSSISFGFYSMRGCRAQMQDAVLTKLNFMDSEDESLFAVFDGHGGVESARFARANFTTIFKKELREGYACKSSDPYSVQTNLRSRRAVDLTASSREDIILAALKKTFETLQNLLENYSIPHGTCALVVYISGSTVYTANAGDSQAILITRSLDAIQKLQKSDEAAEQQTTESLSKGSKPPLTEHAILNDTARNKLTDLIAKFEPQGDASTKRCEDDSGYRIISKVLKPNNPEELQRIEQAGGYVLRGRVNGVIAVSRALGDLEFQPKVIYKPVVTTTSLTNDSPALASAGSSKQKTSCFKGEKEASRSSSFDVMALKPYRSASVRDSQQNMVNVIILGSDGLWDVMKPSDVAMLLFPQEDSVLSQFEKVDVVAIRKLVSKVTTGSMSQWRKQSSWYNWELSRKLCQLALKKGSRDNVSVICIVQRV